MRKSKKIKTIIVEKFKYDNDKYGINLEPSLLLKLLEFAHEEATSDVQLHEITARAHILAHKDDMLDMDDYTKLVTHSTTKSEEPAIEMAVEESPTEEAPAE